MERRSHSIMKPLVCLESSPSHHSLALMQKKLEMSHSIMKPLVCVENSPSHHSLALMQKKLEATEAEARHLMAEIGEPAKGGQLLSGSGDFVGHYAPLNFDDILEGSGNHRIGPRNKHIKGRSLKSAAQSTGSNVACQNNGGISGPSSQGNGDHSTLLQRQNYETLVSRMCRTESAIQSLKFNLVNLKGNYDLKKKQQSEAEEKLMTLAEKYEEDVGKLNRELSKARHDLVAETELKTSLESQLLDVKNSAQSHTDTQAERETEVLILKESNEKLTKKTQSLEQDLAREISLRGSLEQSHNTLLSRMRETELIVERERTQVENLSENCDRLRTELGQLNSNLSSEENSRLLADNKCSQLEKQLGEQIAELNDGEKEQEILKSEINKLRSQYGDLIHQLELMEKLMTEHQAVHCEVEKKNGRLKEALEDADLERDTLIQRQTTQLNMEKAKHGDFERVEEKCLQFQSTVKQLQAENQELLINRERLERELMESETLLKSRDREFRESRESLEVELKELHGKMSDLETAKQQANNDKEDLLKEVNNAVDGMSDERWRLKTELQQAQLDIQALTKTNGHLQTECLALQDRVRALQCHESSQKKLDSTLRESSEDKKRLAYDKGRLQSQVNQLQAEVESLANSRTEFIHLQKNTEILENKYLKAEKELNDYKVKSQHLENQVTQLRESGERREADFTLAIKSRDEAVKENCQLLEKLNLSEEDDNQKVLSLERQLEETQQDTRKITQTLEAVMVSHSQLQTGVENLQIDLGQRDSQITQLNSEKSESKKMTRELQREADLLKQRLITLETLESNELEPLRNALKCCRNDNTKMANSLEDVLDSNSELQTAVDKLQADLMKREQLIEKLKHSREKDQKRIKNELLMYEEKLNTLKNQLQQERDKCAKKSNRDASELKKQCEEMCEKNGELSRANLELRHKVSEHEAAMKELRQKLTNQRTQIDHMTRAKKQMEEQAQHLKDVRFELDNLEKVRDEYIEKNKLQGKSIADLLGQMGSLQSELRHLAQAQFKTRELVQRKEDELETERSLRQDMARKYMDSRKSKEETESQKREFEEKIKLANEESLEVSRNLEAAHDWFKSKFDSLQEELMSSKTAQAELEKDNISQKRKLEEERRRAKMTADRARHMIKSSRKTMSELGDYTDLIATDPKEQVASLHQQIAKQKQSTQRTKGKSKSSSSKQLEALISRYTKR